MNFCEACGTRLGAGERFCSACGKPVGDAAQHPSAAHASANEPLAWEVELPLLSRIMLTQWTGAMLATWLAAMVLLAPVFVAQGEADQLPGLAWIFGAIVAGLWLLGLLVMMLLFRGRYRVRFTVDAKGVLYESLERPVRAATRAGIVAGVLAGRPGVVGAGLLAASREREELR